MNPQCPYTCNISDEKCNSSCSLFQAITYQLINSNIPNYQKAIKLYKPIYKEEQKGIEEYSKIKENIVPLIHEGENIYVCSCEGSSGMTSRSVQLLLSYVDKTIADERQLKGFFISVPEFVGKCKSYTYRQSAEFNVIERNIKNVDMVIWDSLTTWSLDTEDQKLINNYLSKRISSQKSNIYNGVIYENMSDIIGETLAAKINNSIKIRLR